MSDPSEPIEPAEPTIDAAREVLRWCVEHATDSEALPKLNALRGAVLRPELATEVISAAEAVTAPVMAEPAPGPVAQAHMMILLAALLDVSAERDRVDALFARWLRHPTSFGADRPTPPPFQRPEFVQRLGDLLGWGQLELPGDRDGLARFCAWVNTWTPQNKQAVRRTLLALQRNFPAPDVWRRVRFG